eukprot:3148118-Pleurochrysis_carterae.AAC.1
MGNDREPRGLSTRTWIAESQPGKALFNSAWELTPRRRDCRHQTSPEPRSRRISLSADATSKRIRIRRRRRNTRTSVQDKIFILPHLELQKPQATKTQFHTLICLLGEKLDNPNDEVMRVIERLCQDYAPGYASSESLVINYQVLVLRSDERNEPDLHYQDLYWLGQNLEW